MVAAATMVVVLMLAAAIKPRKRLGRKEGAESGAESRMRRGCREGSPNPVTTCAPLLGAARQQVVHQVECLQRLAPQQRLDRVRVRVRLKVRVSLGSGLGFKYVCGLERVQPTRRLA